MTRNKIRNNIIIAFLLCLFVALQMDVLAFSPKSKKTAKTDNQETVIAEEQDTSADEMEEQQDMEIPDSLLTDSLAIDSIPELPWPQSLCANIDTIIAHSDFLQTSQLGLMVYDLTADSVLYVHGEKQTLRPASTMKLLTAITALDKIGGAYQYKTRLCYTGSIVDSVKVLEGDVYYIGGMDPKLGHDDLRNFALSLKELGIDTIRGNVYADKSMKDDDLYGEGWCWDDKNPALSALVYNRKDNAMDYILDALAEAGIFHDGEYGNRKCPKGAKEVCTRTHSISQILTRMMKDSNNLYAESMLYQIGLTQGKPATAKKAHTVMKSLIRKMKMQNTPYRLADGSGLSLYNYVTAELEVAFLRYAYANTNIYEHLYPSLPIAAVDGTLGKRMAGTKAARNVHAKTGTVAGVSSLAGYCKAGNGHELCFAILNQGVMKSSPAKAFQNKVCVAMCK